MLEVRIQIIEEGFCIRLDGEEECVLTGLRAFIDGVPHEVRQIGSEVLRVSIHASEFLFNWLYALETGHRAKVVWMPYVAATA